MPLLQDIVQELDRELTRLHQIRTIVAGLSRTSAVIRRLSEPKPLGAALPATEATPIPKRKARSDAGQRRGARSRKPKAADRALAVTIPSDPVVYYPKRNTAERPEDAAVAAEPVAIPEHTPEQLDAESRALAARWAAQA